MKHIRFDEYGRVDAATFATENAEAIAALAEHYDLYGTLRSWRNRRRGRAIVDFVFDHAILSVAYDWEVTATYPLFSFDKDYYASAQLPDRP